MMTLMIVRLAYVFCVLRTHLRRWGAIYVAVAIAAALFHTRYRIAFNLSDSLPDSVYLVDTKAKPGRLGEYVAFKWDRPTFYAPDWIFVKRVAGLPGEQIVVKDRAVFVAGRSVGYAKPLSSKGVRMTPIKPGVIPPGHYYAAASHLDSLDSRYEVTGLVDTSRMVGTAYAIF